MATYSSRPDVSIRMLLVLVILFSAGLACSGRGLASAARGSVATDTNCGTIFARNYFDGKDVRVLVVRHADCRTARKVLGYYYNSGAPCAGSGCTLTTPGGWSCDTNPGEVQQKSGVITVCEKGAAKVESEILRAGAAATAALGANSAADSSDSTVYFPQSQEASNPAYKPTTLYVAGDGSFLVEHAHWRSWSTTTASGAGTGVHGYADRPHYRDPVEIVLSRPRKLCGHEVWTRGVFVFTHGVPPELQRRSTWTLGVFPCEA